MNGSLFGAYLVTITVLILLPGPDMLFALATGIKSGPRAGFFAAVGAAAGEVVHITTAAVGLAALFRAAPLLFDVMRFVGAAYLLYLGSADALSETCERVGAQPVEPANPYWKQHGVTLVDPDGFHVVLVARAWPLS